MVLNFAGGCKLGEESGTAGLCQTQPTGDILGYGHREHLSSKICPQATPVPNICSQTMPVHKQYLYANICAQLTPVVLHIEHRYTNICTQTTSVLKQYLHANISAQLTPVVLYTLNTCAQPSVHKQHLYLNNTCVQTSVHS